MVWEPQNFAKHLISRCVGAGASIMLVEMERILSVLLESLERHGCSGLWCIPL